MPLFKLPFFNFQKTIVLVPLLLYCFHGKAQKINTDSLLTRFQDQISNTEKLGLANQLFSIYRDSCPDKALFYGNEAIQTAQSMGNDLKLAHQHIKFGRFQEKETNYQNSLEHYTQAFEIYNNQRDKKNMAKTHYYLAKNYKRLGLYDQALSNSLAGLAIFEEFKDSSKMASSYNCMGSIHKYLSEYDKAIDCYNKYLDISQELGNHSAIPTALNNMAVVYELTGDLVLAKSYYERSIDLSKLQKGKNGSAIYLTNLGGIYLKQNNYQKAKAYFLEGLNIHKAELNKRGIAINLGDLGHYYYKVDSLDKAKEFYLEALKVISNSGDAESLRELYFRIHLVYLKEQDYKQAYEYFSRHKKISDELLNSETIKKINNLEWKQKFSRVREQEQIERAKSIFFIIGIITLFGFFLLLVLFFFYKQKAQLNNEKLAKENSELQKRQIESKLELKNKELTNYALQMVRNDEISEYVIERLEETKINLKKENQPMVQSIIFDLKSELKADTWKEFEIRFLEVHQDFYQNLNRNFKDLTPNEQRLCAFLRLNMSTKEISSITHQSPHSINIARGRLRKKLQIAGTNTNLYQLLSRF